MFLFEATSKFAHLGRSLSLLMGFSYSPLRGFGASLVLIFLFLSAIPSISAQQVEIHADPTVSTAGYFQLSWSGHEGVEFEIQEAQNTQFDEAKVLYKGADTASVISGRPNGIYYYRVRQVADVPDTASGWSQPVRVEVIHHSLTDAWRFFATGAIVFILILFFILYGNKRSSVR